MTTRFCIATHCMNPGAYVINGDLLCTSCAKHEIDTDHWCLKHQCVTGEGDICHKCEEEHDHARMLINLEMSKRQYGLWYVWQGRLHKTDVSTFDEAKYAWLGLMTVNSANEYTGVRIARYDPEQGCESVLYSFN